ncbi:hypothetical protein [uncultured Pseudokineococcus sp.]|uniref:hypothetical protein n=1 Tax=uncultured Pseudokineococcus sp. TaxID=1642928 RepID=UPI0026151DD0|nr:hypothetical protein [uncultured Pseudokineococcus sp.]
MRSTDTPSRLSSRSRGLLRLVAIVSAVLGVLALVGLAIRAITAPGRSTVAVSDMSLSNADTPPFTTELPDLRAYYSGVNLEIGDPPASLVWLDVAHQAAAVAGIVAVCALLVWLCLATLRGRPFATSAPLVLVASGLVLFASSVATDLLAGRIQAAVVDLYGLESTGGSRGEGFAVGTTVLFDGGGLAVTLCVLGAVFALGSRLQRDTDQLI